MLFLTKEAVSFTRKAREEEDDLIFIVTLEDKNKAVDNRTGVSIKIKVDVPATEIKPDVFP